MNGGLKKDPKKETIMDARKKMPKRYEKDTKKDAKRAKKDMKKRWHHQKERKAGDHSNF